MNRNRIYFAIAVALWTSSLFEPYIEIHSSSRTGRGIGLFLLEYGWLGPFDATVAWYANIPFFIAAATMLWGRPPNRYVAGLSLGLALTGLLPMLFHSDDPDLDDVMWLRGLAVWLWLAAFLTIQIAALQEILTSRIAARKPRD